MLLYHYPIRIWLRLFINGYSISGSLMTADQRICFLNEPQFLSREVGYGCHCESRGRKNYKREPGRRQKNYKEQTQELKKHGRWGQWWVQRKSHIHEVSAATLPAMSFPRGLWEIHATRGRRGHESKVPVPQRTQWAGQEEIFKITLTLLLPREISA